MEYDLIIVKASQTVTLMQRLNEAATDGWRAVSLVCDASKSNYVVLVERSGGQAHVERGVDPSEEDTDEQA